MSPIRRTRNRLFRRSASITRSPRTSRTLIVRVTAGVWLMQHGWVKVMAGVNAVAAGALARRGIEPALPLAYLITFLEGVGGFLITIGLFTRPEEGDQVKIGRAHV